MIQVLCVQMTRGGGVLDLQFRNKKGLIRDSKVRAALATVIMRCLNLDF